jgi:glycosyltransferase involved in cell wall biosynthesis
VVNTSSKEGWGLTVVEANACGAPCVAANVPGLRDSVLDGKTGLLYPYGNIDALVERIRRVLLEPGLRSSLSEQALRWADSFDWENAADETLGYMRATIARHASRHAAR